jgi:hypothetical protein
LWEAELPSVLLGYKSRNRSLVKRARGSEEANWRLVLALLYYRRQDTETVQNSGKIELPKIACEAECCACTLKQVNLRRLPWFLLIDDSFCFTCPKKAAESDNATFGPAYILHYIRRCTPALGIRDWLLYHQARCNTRMEKTSKGLKTIKVNHALQLETTHTMRLQ